MESGSEMCEGNLRTKMGGESDRGLMAWDLGDVGGGKWWSASVKCAFV